MDQRIHNYLFCCPSLSNTKPANIQTSLPSMYLLFCLFTKSRNVSQKSHRVFGPRMRATPLALSLGRRGADANYIILVWVWDYVQLWPCTQGLCTIMHRLFTARDTRCQFFISPDGALCLHVSLGFHFCMWDVRNEECKRKYIFVSKQNMLQFCCAC